MGKFVVEVDPFQFITSMKCLRSYFDQVVRATKLLYLRVTKALFPYFRDGRGQSEFFQFFANPKCILRQLPYRPFDVDLPQIGIGKGMFSDGCDALGDDYLFYCG